MVECNLAKVEVESSNLFSRSTNKPSVRRGLVVFLLILSGCAHQVRVESNIKEAEVRVDGVPIGTVGEGAVFTERAGLSTVYDIEVHAEGYRTARRRLSPTVPSPWVGVPAMCSLVTGCTTASCVVPLSLLLVGVSPDDADVQCIGSGCAGGSAAWAAGSAAVAAWGGEQMPDVVTINLEPDSAGAMAH